MPVWLAIAALAFAGCATRDSQRTPEERLRQSLADSSQVSRDAAWVAVEAESQEAAWGEVVRARTESPREASLVLARLFEESRVRPREVVVGGPYPPLTDQVLRDAFGMVPGELPGLRLVEVSAEPLSEGLRALCRERRAACRHEAWVAPPR